MKLYAPSKYIEVIGIGTSKGIDEVKLPQAISAWASILEAGRYIEIRSFSLPVQGQPIVRIRTSVEISARDVSSFLLYTPSVQGGTYDPVSLTDTPFVADVWAGPRFMPQVVSLSQKKGEWILEILDFGPALAGIEQQMEVMKKDGFTPVYFVIRSIIGFLTVMVGAGVGPCEGIIWLGLGRVDALLSDLLAITMSSEDSLRSWKIWVDTFSPLNVVVLAREERPGISALNLAIAWQ
jgi:hypothetical protein